MGGGVTWRPKRNRRALAQEGYLPRRGSRWVSHGRAATVLRVEEVWGQDAWVYYAMDGSSEERSTSRRNFVLGFSPERVLPKDPARVDSPHKESEP